MDVPTPCILRELCVIPEYAYQMLCEHSFVTWFDRGVCILMAEYVYSAENVGESMFFNPNSTLTEKSECTDLMYTPGIVLDP